MKIISHSADADGIVSAFLVARKFNITDENDFIMTDYGKNTDWYSKISDNEEVIICDFSFENGPEDMKKLLGKTKKVIWIDHHISAINKYKELESKYTIPGIRKDGTAATMLTYFYFYIPQNEKGKYDNIETLYNETPSLVKYVHDHDVWRYDYKETGAFNLGFNSLNIISPLDPKLEKLFTDEDYVKEIINIGKNCEQYRDSLGDRACTNYGFETEINGKKGFALNNCFGGSPWFGDRVKKYDFVCVFLWMGKEKQWEYSFYSDKDTGCNCYELAQSIDPKGGGHEHAAGCVSKKFIFGE